MSPPPPFFVTPLAFDHRRVGPSGPPMVGYLYASRLLLTSLGSGLGPSRLGFTVTSLGSWPPAQPTRTHGHVPRRQARVQLTRTYFGSPTVWM